MGRPKGTGGQARELARKEIARIDKCLTGTTHEHRNRALIYLGLGSGMRISEMVGLTISSICPVQDILPAVILEKHSTKSKRSRTVALSKQAQWAVQKYLNTRFHNTLPDRRRSLWLFPGRTYNKPLSPSSAVRLVKQVFGLAGIVGASSHSLRRTHANTLRRAGVDLKIIQDQLGHGSLATTEKYFRVDPLEQLEVVGRLKF